MQVNSTRSSLSKMAMTAKMNIRKFLILTTPALGNCLIGLGISAVAFCLTSPLLFLAGFKISWTREFEGGPWLYLTLWWFALVTPPVIGFSRGCLVGYMRIQEEAYGEKRIYSVIPFWLLLAIVFLISGICILGDLWNTWWSFWF